MEHKINTKSSQKFCAVCDKPMVLRISNKTKQKFYGCTGYPECKNIKLLPELNLTNDLIISSPKINAPTSGMDKSEFEKTNSVYKNLKDNEINKEDENSKIKIQTPKIENKNNLMNGKIKFGVILSYMIGIAGTIAAITIIVIDLLM